MRKTLLFLFLSISGMSAHASEIPRYNPEAYCRQVANVSGGSSMIFNGCLDMEQESYNNLKRIWVSIPNRTKEYCHEVASISGRSYSILEGCIDMEIDSIRSNKTFQF